MKSKFPFLLNTVLLLFLAGINLYIFLNRNDGYAYKEYLDYKQLYELKDDLRLVETIVINGDSLVLKISPVSTSSLWEAGYDDNHSGQASQTPTLKLMAGKHIYKLKNISVQKTPMIELGINFTTGSEYKKNGRRRGSVVELYFSSIPVGDYKTYGLSHWQQDSPYSTDADAHTITRLISENTSIKKNDSTLTKLKKTAAFLLNKLDTRRGIPADVMDSISPAERYNRAIQGKSKVWCGDFSSIYAFFLKVQGITSREVCTEGRINDVLFAGHSLNEVYIPEWNKWVMSDLTSKTLLVSYDGNFLNTLDLYELQKNNVKDLKVLSYQNDSLIEKEYETVKPFYNYYFKDPHFVYYLNRQYNKKLYSPSSKFKRYFFKNPTFALHSGTHEMDNQKFYCKQFAAGAFIIFLLYSVVCYFLSRNTKKQNAS